LSIFCLGGEVYLCPFPWTAETSNMQINKVKDFFQSWRSQERRKVTFSGLVQRPWLHLNYPGFRCSTQKVTPLGHSAETAEEIGTAESDEYCHKSQQNIPCQNRINHQNLQTRHRDSISDLLTWLRLPACPRVPSS